MSCCEHDGLILKLLIYSCQLIIAINNSCQLKLRMLLQIYVWAVNSFACENVCVFVCGRLAYPVWPPHFAA